jgi:hypothetical protein
MANACEGKGEQNIVHINVLEGATKERWMPQCLGSLKLEFASCVSFSKQNISEKKPHMYGSYIKYFASSCVYVCVKHLKRNLKRCKTSTLWLFLFWSAKKSFSF